MAAGLGFKEFTTGDVLTAADANGYLASQVVMVFADATARTAAITSPQEGMISYLKDTNATQYYSGSAWVTIGGSASPLTTKGDLYTYSTADARLAVGANGTVLTADSAAATGLKWAAAGGAGKVLQVVSATLADDISSSSTSYVDTGLSASITPSSATSKILTIQSSAVDVGSGNANNAISLKLFRDATNILTLDDLFFTGTALRKLASYSYTYLDSPATTSAITYKIQFCNNVAAADVTFAANNNTATLLLLEIGA